jgi:hypothetical protein
MWSRAARWLGVLIAICAPVACGGGGGIAPSPVGYAGEWTGTTSNGPPIRFSVSAADTVTSITLVYSFSADCSGTLTYTDLAVPIRTSNPPGLPASDQLGFGYSTTNGVNGTLIAGGFSPDRRSASGQFALVHFGACDTVVGTWTAQRH